MSTIDQQFVEYIVKTLVNNPDKVTVERRIDEKGVLLELTVDAEDVGRVIGRHGVTAQSIRTLLRALGTKNDARYNLKIINTDEEGTEDSTPKDKSASTNETFGNDEENNSGSDTDSNESDNDEEETSNIAERTRAELADLDDLDI